jgi:RimJ/RimL family protein N-acetyltransferase
MIVRELTADDAEAFWALRLHGFREAPTSFGYSFEESVNQPLAEVRTLLGREGRSPSDFVLGALHGDELVGIVGLERALRQKRAHRATLWGMVVAPAMRGRGIGRLLGEALLQRARQIPGLRRINLTVMAHNEPGVALYRSLGFEVWGREPDAMRLSGVSYAELSMGLDLCAAGTNVPERGGPAAP